MKTTIRAAFAILAVFCSAAAASEIPIRIEEKTLDNGLKVIAARFKGLPHAACAVGVRSGSSIEVPGATGLAHFLEHMMFKGTDKLGVKDLLKDSELLRKIDETVARIAEASKKSPPDKVLLDSLRAEKQRLFKEEQENLIHDHIDKIYEEAGSLMTNAFTSEDSTVYFTLLPHSKIELFFWIESERFRNPVFRQFHSEKEVVREERRLAENQEGHAFNEEMNRAVFGSHPYANPVIGSHRDIEGLTRDDLMAFFGAQYTPDNMFVMVGADEEAERVFELAARYFGAMPPSKAKRRRVPDFTPRRAAEARVYGTGSGVPYFGIAYRLPPADPKLEAALDMMALRLSDPEGPLHRELVDEGSVATSITSYFRALRHAGDFWVDVEIRPERDPLDAEPVVRAAVAGLSAAELSETEMNALKRKYRASILGNFKDEMSLAMLLMERELLGSWKNLDALLKAAAGLSARDLRAAAALYLVPENSVVGVFGAEEEDGEGEGEGDVEEEPAGAKTAPEAPKQSREIPPSWENLEFREKPLVVPDPESHLARLSNGIRVVLVPDANDPSFSITASFAGGESEVEDSKAGTIGLMASVANRSGMPGMTRKELSGKLEDLAAEFGVAGGTYAIRFSINGFPGDQAGLLDLFGKLTLNLSLDPERFEAARDSLKSSTIERECDPGSTSGGKAMELAAGGALDARRATVETLGAVTFADVEEALSRHRDPGRCTLAVAGNFDRASMLAQLEKVFGGWETRGSPLPKLDPGRIEPQRKGLFLAEFDTTQGFVNMAALGPAATGPDYPAACLAQDILNERFYKVIRSEEGLAYDASAWMMKDWRRPSLLLFSFQTKSESVPFGLSLAFGLMEKLASEGPSDKELEDARRRFETGLKARYGRAESVCEAILDLVTEPGASAAHFKSLWDRLKLVAAGDVQAAARKYLARDSFTIVCAGDPGAVEKGDGIHPHKLSDFGAPLKIDVAKPPAGPAGPGETVSKVMRCLCSGDIQGMRKHFTESFLAELGDEGSELEAMNAMLSSAKFEVSEVREKGDAAEADVRIDVDFGGRKMAVELTFGLAREKGRWLVNGIEEK